MSCARNASGKRMRRFRRAWGSLVFAAPAAIFEAASNVWLRWPFCNDRPADDFDRFIPDTPPAPHSGIAGFRRAFDGIKDGLDRR